MQVVNLSQSFKLSKLINHVFLFLLYFFNLVPELIKS